MCSDKQEVRIGIIGLGYVGLPLALAFSGVYPTVGYDTSSDRIDELGLFRDHTLEADTQALREALQAGRLRLSSRPGDLLPECNVYIVTVPTPIDKSNRPLLAPLIEASRTIAKVLKRGDLVVYESTTYPGCTEEVCVPEMERESGLKYNTDFFCGYSPERINPGDRTNTLKKIRKVTSGSTPEAARRVDALYSTIIDAGTYMAPSIKVAEASKAIENAQRDLNISFVNELSLIFDRMGIDTNDVLDAAATKWNFRKYKPGLVGGHCIGVDPYYLAYKANSLGYYPEVILSGRRVNNSIAKFIADKVIKLLIGRDARVKDASALIMGFTFKENCPDTRNTKVVDIARELGEWGMRVDFLDPLADPEKARREYGVDITSSSAEVEHKAYGAIIVAVAHDQFRNFDFEWQKRHGAIIFDVKGIVPRELADARL